ncbi:MAG: ribose-phosphate pyrophosphokinase [Desulfomonilia bacterium]|jgi:ribose-phosphate pyrophosphokinase|uniref:ribose-phosphate diphosphokinase n=1 Tax=anaerobic digester metagenome TaxID=1263854 RepID=A0A485M455_9ZZZZ|nr:ribose-phosphate pyrophosphokinase [Pseudomonadota bacterium]HON37128.1 ribose-phosphate pyrophosphokinase [Deltaproteobacteria bacterium]HRS54914.1 ribose-phosphate pyrophosphokinase [Desulfomonilia bacterium]HPD20114.1 ribose-phosphate pyrophosphokinase [Deltaproteobacteria bacterium]HPX17832.1 ribose-phosphate pyrophosphokinase [Deltaproteobacteria bacterium]
METDICVFSGNSNRPLAESICGILGIEIGSADVKRFSDGETSVEIHESIRGKDIYLVQSTCSPTNEHLMELLVMLDAVKRASARIVTAVIPYFGYARQDRKASPRTPITAKLVANLLTTAGADRILTMDLHAGQIQGFFDIPVDNLYAKPVMLNYIKDQYTNHLCIVSPDAGGVERARAYAKPLKADLAIIDKKRERANESDVMHIIGDVKGKICLLIDDIVDTAGTLTNGAVALRDAGATKVAACCTHAVLSGPAISRINNSPLEELVVTDTIPLKGDAAICKKITVLSVAPLLGEAMKRIYSHESVSELFLWNEK